MSELESLKSPEELEEREGEESRGFVLAFSRLVRVSRFHDLENSALYDSFEEVSERSRDVADGQKRFVMLFQDEQIFVNQKRLKFSAGAYRSIHDLEFLLGRKSLAGVEIRSAISEEHLKVFLRLLNEVEAGDTSNAKLINDALTDKSVKSIVVFPADVSDQVRSKSLQLERGQYAILLYAKLIVLFKDVLKGWEDVNARRYLLARIKRVLQQLITFAETTPRYLHWLIHQKGDEEYHFSHSVNVTLLAILLANHLELSRSKLLDLGLAALLHDIGRLRLPSELEELGSELTDEHREELEKLKLHGLNMLLESSYIDESVLRQLIVIFEHAQPKTVEGLRTAHLFSRIIRVAHVYDALTTRRPYRDAKTPTEAVALLQDGSGTEYDADIVRLFVSVMGLFPLGTLVHLDTGEGGLIFHLDPSLPYRPLVKLVWDESGQRLEDGPVVDLSERDGSGQFKRSIVDAANADEYQINVPAYLQEVGY